MYTVRWELNCVYYLNLRVIKEKNLFDVYVISDEP
jgi:hypothetical protein